MTDANYQKHFKVIGKLALLYDYVGEVEATLEGYVAALYDQLWTGAQASYDAGVLLSGSAEALARTVVQAAGGTTSRKSQLAAMLRAYMTSAAFRDDVTIAPTDINDAADVAEALQFEMEDDAKTLGTEGSTGMVNFMETACVPVNGPSVGWTTESDATADYKDATYVVEAQV